MILLSRILLLSVIIVLLVFSISNLEPVTVKILTWQSMEMPLFLVMLFAFFLGFALALVWQAFRSFTSPRRSRAAPAPAPIIEKKERPEKVKKSWFKKASQTAEPAAKEGALKATPSSAVRATSNPADESDLEVKPDAEVDSK